MILLHDYLIRFQARHYNTYLESGLLMSSHRSIHAYVTLHTALHAQTDCLSMQ